MKTKNDKKKLAVLCRHFSTDAGGGERYCVELTSRLVDDYDVHVFSQRFDAGIGGITFHQISAPIQKPRWLNLLWFNYQSYSLCRGFDLIHSHEMVPFAHIVTQHVRCSTPDFSQFPLGKRIRKRLQFLTSLRKQAYRLLEKGQLKPGKGKRVVLVSEMLRPHIQRIYGFDVRQYRVIPPGIDLPAPGSQLQARKQLAVPEDKTLLLLVSNDFIAKGLQQLVELLTRLPEQVELLVAGNDDPLPFIEQAQKMGVEHRLTILGSQKQMLPVYQAADILVHPTRFDTYSMVALEAMACGKPVVISSAEYCGVSAEITDQALLLNDPASVDELAEKVGSVLADNQLRQRLSDKGLLFAQAHSWNEITRRYQQTYADVLAER